MTTFPEETEIVRKYAKALIFEHKIWIVPKSDVLEIKLGTNVKEVAKEIRKAKRLEKKKENIPHSMHAQMRASGPSQQELAELAARSEQALRAAASKAGEPVVYCCAQVRTASSIDYECACRKSLRHCTINGWEYNHDEQPYTCRI